MQLRPWIILAALALARIAFGYQFQTIAALATDLTQRFGLTYAQLGSLIGSYMLLGVFAALPLGLLARRFGDHAVLGIGLALMTAGSCISAGADTPAGIAAGRTIAGVGAVAMIVLQGKIIAEWFSGPRFMIGISVSVGGFPIGMGLAQLILPPVLQGFGAHFAFLTDAMPAALALLLFLASHRKPPGDTKASGRLSLPSVHECLLLGVAGSIWTAYTAGSSAFVAFLPTTLAFRGDGLAVAALVMTIATWGTCWGPWPAAAWLPVLAASMSS